MDKGWRLFAFGHSEADATILEAFRFISYTCAVRDQQVT
jgi:hypothetical protein